MAIVTIAGTACSGKSTLAKLLADRLGYKHYSIGGIRREIARSKGISLEELNRLSASGEEDTDTPVDEQFRQLGEAEDNFVADCRTGFHFIPHSIKILLDADKEVRAQRLFQRESVGEHPTSLEHAREMIETHMKSERLRYMKYYGVNIWDKHHYDLVLDSTTKTPEELVEDVLRKFPFLSKTVKQRAD
jgi:CMP/dCMP kinase